MLDVLMRHAVQTFFQKERANILNGVAERNLCARLALYIELEMEQVGLQGYYADVEYNRKQNGAVKTIMDDEYQIIRINCDLILHSRGEIIQRDNLIAVEMKKIERPQYEKDSDINRLRAMTKKVMMIYGHLMEKRTQSMYVVTNTDISLKLITLIGVIMLSLLLKVK